jgi:hypothetical protein
MLVRSLPGIDELWTFLPPGLTGCVIHCGEGCRLALEKKRACK